MANRVPLIVDTSTLFIKELPTGDNLDLTGSGIVGLAGVGGTTGNFSGIVTASAFYVDSNVVLTNSRELSNIASVDATTKATLESALQTGPNDFTYLNVTGVSTLGGGLSQLRVTGVSTFSSAVGFGTTATFPDGAAVYFGAGEDLQIYHNGTDSYVRDTATGSLILTGSRVIVKNAADNARMIDATEGGAVKLLHNNVERLETTPSGATITGIATFTDTGAIVSGVTTISGTSHLRIPVGTTGQRYGSAVDGDIRYNSDLNSYEGYGNGAWGGLGGGTEIDQAVSSTSPTNITTFAHASYRSASLRIQIVQGSSYQVGRYLLIHDGTTVTMIEESAVATGSMLGSISGSINGSNVEIKVTMDSASSATVTTIIDKITV